MITITVTSADASATCLVDLTADAGNVVVAESVYDTARYDESPYD